MRWLYIERNAVVVAVTVDHWLDNGHDIEVAGDFDTVMRRIKPRFGEYAVYARTELDGTPDLDDLRTRLSFEIG